MTEHLIIPKCTRHNKLISVCSKLFHIHHFLDPELCDSLTFKAGSIDLTRQNIIEHILKGSGRSN